jgi:hypothetical protein
VIRHSLIALSDTARWPVIVSELTPKRPGSIEAQAVPPSNQAKTLAARRPIRACPRPPRAELVLCSTIAHRRR